MTEQPNDRQTPPGPQVAESVTAASPSAAKADQSPLGLCAGTGRMLAAGLLVGLVAWLLLDQAFPFYDAATTSVTAAGEAAGQEDSDQMMREAHLLKRKNSSVAGAILAALAGLFFSVVEARQRPGRRGTLAAIVVAVLLAAVFGALAGFAAQEFHRAWLLDTRLEPMQRTMATQGIFWMLVAAGVGLGLGLFTGRFGLLVGTVLQAVMSMAAFAPAYVMLAGFLFPIDDADRLVPASSGNLALWCLAAMGLLGLFLGLARRRRRTSSTPPAAAV